MTKELYNKFWADVITSTFLKDALLEGKEKAVRGYVKNFHTLTEDELTELFKAMEEARALQEKYVLTRHAMNAREVLAHMVRVSRIELGYGE